MLEAWYWCRITEHAERDEPDWSRIPEERRAIVRDQWNATSMVSRRWKLWGPQIPFFQRHYVVEVEGLA